MLYQLNNTDNESMFLIESGAGQGIVTKVWSDVYTLCLEGDEEEEMVLKTLQDRGFTADRVFLIEIIP